MTVPPPSLVAASEEERSEAGKTAESVNGDRILSAREVREYQVHANDGKVGAVQDLLLDDDCARVLFLAVTIDGILTGKDVLVPARLITRVDWSDSTIHLDANRRAVESSQEYKPAA